MIFSAIIITRKNENGFKIRRLTARGKRSRLAFFVMKRTQKKLRLGKTLCKLVLYQLQ
jgi:hypothetical protein